MLNCEGAAAEGLIDALTYYRELLGPDGVVFDYGDWFVESMRGLLD